MSTDSNSNSISNSIGEQQEKKPRKVGSRFNQTQVLDIRRRAKKGELLSIIAKDYYCTNQCISSVRTGKTYKDFGGPLTGRMKGMKKRKATQIPVKSKSNKKLESELVAINARRASAARVIRNGNDPVATAVRMLSRLGPLQKKIEVLRGQLGAVADEVNGIIGD
jgi:hypothetical protein